MGRNNVDSNDYERRKLYRAALSGDWKSVENMSNIQRTITNNGETALHIAAVANQEHFVKNLMYKRHVNVTAENKDGNTALTYAAATGNVNIAKAMLERNRNLENQGRMKPLFMAASLGHSKLVQYLYTRTKDTVHGWDQDQQDQLFITCVEGNLYGIAMDMLEANNNLAQATNENGETVLHLLARKPSAFVSETRPWLKLKQDNSKQASELFKKCLQEYRDDVGNSLVHVLFGAAEEGNIECLIMLIRFDYDLLWKNISGKSIFHVAAEKRHESIFYLLYEIGSIGDLLIDRKEDGSNILHLAAELAPQEKLSAISGAALQMQREVLWFKEVEKVVSPAFKEMKNNNGDGYTPYVLFAKKHEELRTKGEKWMTDTANYSMVVATLIGSTMFSGLIADGSDRSSKQHYLAFSVASAISLFSSSTSLVMFLSILTSRYSYSDFVLWLPLRLLIGIASLCISIAAMMVAFFISFLLANNNGKELPVIFVVIGLFAIAPIIYWVLKWYLFVDIARSTFSRFKPRQRQRLLYKEVSHDHESACLAIDTHCINVACRK